ncbi:uncharacterized protein MKZ38_010336 [Zalerion maritima]|uniref:Chromatin modification-related protein n=1 Tax=Zalerion maritima TaxID=339359 RepID=A0AAD5RYF5_9PEZI|nr:uncharacterized protein MKZ38_010336 [Zalerion maritima]
MPAVEGVTSSLDEAASPRDRSTLQEAMDSMGPLPDDMDPLESRVADSDFGATVNDFLDFTEYLPSDTIRSMTLISKLDSSNRKATTTVNQLTQQWSQLPELAPEDRTNPVALRAKLSRALHQVVSSRVYSYAEAKRIQDNVTRHHNRMKYMVGKLENMLQNFPTAEKQEQQTSPAAPRSPNMVRAKAARISGKEEKMSRQRVPRITVPGDVLAPYEINYAWTEDDDDSESSDDESIEASMSPPPTKRGHGRATPGAQPKIKIMKTPKPKVPKAPKEPKPKKAPPTIPLIPLSQLKPPPENPVIGSPDAPWLQLTLYELAKLRKRMKKNANWTPSETMVARELKNFDRGPEEFKAAKKKAEEEGNVFEPVVPQLIDDPVTGDKRLPPGAMSIDSVTASEIPTSNRGMKLNEAKKLKRDMAKLAAQEAEESARKFEELARRLMWQGQAPNFQQQQQQQQQQGEGQGSSASRKPSRSSKKRKMEEDPTADAEGGKPDVGESTTSSASRPSAPKRAKTETPVPPPMLTPSGSGVPSEKQPTPAPSTHNAAETPNPSASRPSNPVVMHSQTPVPIPILPHHNSSQFKKTTSASPPAPAPASGSISSALSVSSSKASDTDHSPAPEACPAGDNATTGPAPAYTNATSLQIPLKPAHETQAPLSLHSPNKTATPILPPSRESSKRIDKRTSEAKTPDPPSVPLGTVGGGPTPAGLRSSSRAGTPKSSTPAPELQPPQVLAGHRRPPSRNTKAPSQEPPLSAGLAAERPRRASTAHNTPAPDAGSSVGGVTQGFAHPNATGSSTSRPSTATGRRSKRPAPGVVSTTTNGSNSAVGRRKTATKKKARTNRKQVKDDSKSGAGGSHVVDTIVMEEVDDDGNVIDPDEPRYCLCNRVSFGTMIQCENIDQSCRGEWFHLQCVDLTDIPPRTTKWYCPDCRKALNIGEKGEVSARGVRM